MPASAEPSEPAYAWVIVWACFVALAVIFGVAYSFAAFFESFATQFSAQRADVSLVFGLSGLIYFTLGIGGGMLSDRVGPRVVCCVGMVFIAVGLLATSFAHAMATVYLAYGVGVGVPIFPGVSIGVGSGGVNLGLGAGAGPFGVGVGSFG